MVLKKRLPSIQRRRSSGWGYLFPPLADCRRAFERQIGSTIDWPEETPMLVVVGKAAAE
jgi:hypothetical protein